MVTFHHFTHPRWLAAAGTWEAPHAADRFARFCERATAHLGDLIGMACTLNEPNVVATMGWRHGIFPPRVRDRARRDAVNDALVAAHRRAVEAIRSGPGDFPVGLTLSMTDYQLQPGGEEWLERLRRPSEDVFLEATGGDDFIGVQTYTRMRVGPDGALGGEEGVPTTQMGYEFWPEALEGTIRRAWDKTGGLPVYVTENGIGTDDDAARIEYVRAGPGRGPAAASTTASTSGATSTGACWTTSSGCWATARPSAWWRWTAQTFERTPKPSASWFGDGGPGQRALSRPRVPGAPRGRSDFGPVDD